MGKPSTKPTQLRFLLVLLVISLASKPAISQTAPSALTVPLILPSALVFDTVGNLYLAETASHVIRKVDTTGHITTIAGTGTQGFSGDGGPATVAQLDSPQGLALTATTLYIADTHNHRIRALNLTTNLITTIAGTGTPGFSGDSTPATTAQLNLPTALALDSTSLYLADTQNHRIRRINLTTGIITTIVGNGTQGYSGDTGPALNAAIDSPTGIAVNLQSLYLADTHNHRIRRIDLATNIITTIPTSPLNLPHGLTLDASGNLYIADTANHRIARIDATSGIVTTIAGTTTQSFSGDSAPATAATLDSPRAITLSPASLPTLADTANQRIRQLDILPTPNIHTIAGLGTTAPGTLTLTAPAVIAYGSGTLTAALAAGTPATGSITFLENNTTLVTTPLSTNSATFSTASLTTGPHTLTATYSGDLTHAPAQSAALSLTITSAPTVITLTPSATSLTFGQPATFSTHTASTTTGTPTGTVVFLDNTFPIATTPLTASGDATYTTATLSPSVHTISAAYSGNTNFAPSTSPAFEVAIIAPIVPPTTPTDFTLTPTSATALTIPSGNTATYTLTTQTIGPALSSPITLTITGLPTGATASINPTLIPPGTTNGTFTVTITTLKKATASPINAALLLLFLPTLFLIKKQSASTLKIRGRLLLLATLITTAGCGDRINTTSNATTAPITYTLTLTATATSPTGTPLQHITTVTLTLQ